LLFATAGALLGTHVLATASRGAEIAAGVYCRSMVAEDGNRRMAVAVHRFEGAQESFTVCPSMLMLVMPTIVSRLNFQDWTVAVASSGRKREISQS